MADIYLLVTQDSVLCSSIIHYSKQILLYQLINVRQYLLNKHFTGFESQKFVSLKCFMKALKNILAGI